MFFFINYQSGRESFYKVLESGNGTEGHSKFLHNALKNLQEKKPLQYIGVTDDVIPSSQAQYIQENFSFKKKSILRSKHFCQEDQPEEFSKAIIQFIQELPSEK